MGRISYRKGRKIVKRAAKTEGPECEENWLQERQKDSKASSIDCRTRRIGYRVNRIGCRMDRISYRKTSVADPGSGALLTPGSGMGKKSGSGSKIQIRDEQPGSYFRELRNIFLF